MSEGVKQRLRESAETKLNPAFKELVLATKQPFISTIRDSFTPQLRLLYERLIFIGEAATFGRQAARHSICAQSNVCF